MFLLSASCTQRSSMIEEVQNVRTSPAKWEGGAQHGIRRIAGAWELPVVVRIVRYADLICDKIWPSPLLLDASLADYLMIAVLTVGLQAISAPIVPQAHGV